MKLLLISPPFGEKGQKSKGLPIAPPVLEYLVGLTRMVRPDIEIELVDANKEPFSAEDLNADFIGFTVLTPQAPWVYDTADKLRSIGKKVILGGIHVTTDEREDAIVKLRADLFTIPKIFERVFQVSWKGFPMSHITSWMIQYPQGRAFKQFARERKDMKSSCQKL